MITKRREFLESNIKLILIFAVIYKLLPKGSFNKEIGTFDCLYFSTVTHTTLGYGDIYPVTNTAKLLCSIQSFLIYFLVTEAFVKV